MVDEKSVSRFIKALKLHSVLPIDHAPEGGDISPLALYEECKVDKMIGNIGKI